MSNEIQKKEFHPSDIKLSKNGDLEIKNFDELYRIAQVYCQSGMLPKQYDKPEKVITGMQYAKDLGLKSITSLRQICVINGSPSIFGDLPLAMVRKCGELEYIKEFLFDESQKEISFKNKNLLAKFMGAACIIKRKGSGKQTYTFTLPDAAQAKLLEKDVWKNYPKMMLKYRARSIALKDLFSDILGGIAIKEYDENEIHYENNIPVSNEPEIVQEREQITEEKIQGLKNMENYFEQLKLNDAKKLALKTKFLKCVDPYFATIENIVKLNSLLLKEISNAKKENIDQKADKKNSKKENNQKK